MKSYTALPCEYGEIYSLNLQKDKKKAILVNGIAVIIGVAMALFAHFFVSPVSSLFDFSDGFGMYFLRFGVLIASSVAYIILHEAVHGVAMKICGTKKIKYGFTGLYAFAGSDDYYPLGPYVFIALAPVVLFGMIFAVLCVFLEGAWFWVIYILQITNISGAAGDLFVTVRFLLLPKDILVRDFGVSMTVYSKTQDGSVNI